MKGRIPRVRIEDYPAVKAHLDQFWDKIKDRADQGDTPYNLRNCAYLEDFSKPKAMWKIIGCNINFSFDYSHCLCNNAVNIITGHEELLLQFVGIMNSKLFDWYLKLTTEAEVQGGGIQLYVTTLEKTLVKLDFSEELSNVVRNRIRCQASDNDVDNAVFKAYGIDSTEQSFILTHKKVNR